MFHYSVVVFLLLTYYISMVQDYYCNHIILFLFHLLVMCACMYICVNVYCMYILLCSGQFKGEVRFRYGRVFHYSVVVFLLLM